MTKYKLEYIWLDGYTPVPSLRGKTQIKEFESFPTLEQLPLWGFDGSSTKQAEGRSSDCVLKPVAVYPDGARTNGALVMCEVMMPDGRRRILEQARDHSRRSPAPGSASSRNISFIRTAVRSAFPRVGFPAPQGPYYTGVGYKNVGDIARKMVEEHLDICLAAGINHEGINAEVAKGQWEFQIFGKGSKTRRRRNVDRPLSDPAPDREIRRRHRIPLQAARRHRLERLRHARQFLDGLYARSRRQGIFRGADEGFREHRDDHIAVYGPDNHMRLTGQHETASIHQFSYGIADRGASIRVPHSFVNNGYKGYLEDRRPNSQGDPYQIASQILKTIASVPTAGKVSAAA